jgi:hypothetical protein
VSPDPGTVGKLLQVQKPLDVGRAAGQKALAWHCMPYQWAGDVVGLVGLMRDEVVVRGIMEMAEAESGRTNTGKGRGRWVHKGRNENIIL